MQEFTAFDFANMYGAANVALGRPSFTPPEMLPVAVTGFRSRDRLQRRQHEESMQVWEKFAGDLGFPIDFRDFFQISAAFGHGRIATGEDFDRHTLAVAAHPHLGTAIMVANTIRFGEDAAALYLARTSPHGDIASENEASLFRARQRELGTPGELLIAAQAKAERIIALMLPS